MTSSLGLVASPVMFDHVGRLDASVVALHLNPQPAAGRGHFRVRRGPRLGNLLATVLRMPNEGHAVPVSIRVERFPDHEVWHRTIGEFRLSTTLERHHDGVVERIGRNALRFCTASESGALVMRLTHLSSRIAGVDVAWPRRLGFDVTARVSGVDGGSVHVFVELQQRWLGRVLTYAGDLDVSPSGEMS